MAEVVRYINTASSGGDGTTNATSGANAAYASLAAWNTAEATDLVTAGDTHRVICTGGTDGSNGVSLAGWTLGPSNTLTIESPDARTPGVFASGYRLLSTGFIANIISAKANVFFKNIYFQANETGSSNRVINLTDSSSSNYCTFENCWIRNANTLSTGEANGIRLDAGFRLRLINTLVECVGGTGQAVRCTSSSGHVELINSLVYGNASGVNIGTATSTVTVRNSIVVGQSTASMSGANGTWTVENTIHETNTISGGATLANNIQWTLGTTDYAANFEDYLNGDFRPAAGSDQIDAGQVQASASPDHYGVTRPQGSAYDIGPFELAGAAVPTISSVTPSTIAAGSSPVIAGTNFEASQGTGTVKLSPTDDVDDVNAATQSITSWGDTSITLNGVSFPTGTSHNDTLYLFVTNDTGDSNAAGFAVTANLAPTLTSGAITNRTVNGFTIGFTTDVANGTAYYAVYTTEVAANAATDQDIADEATSLTNAVAAGSKTVSASTAQTFTAVDSLSDDTQYWVRVVHYGSSAS